MAVVINGKNLYRMEGIEKFEPMKEIRKGVLCN